MFKIGKDNKMTLTRGDSLYAKVNLVKKISRQPYEPQPGDRIRFAVKKNYGDLMYAIHKDIPRDTLILHIEPEDTKNLDYGEYVYDIELTTADGDVDTFIARSKFVITEEVQCDE